MVDHLTNKLALPMKNKAVQDVAGKSIQVTLHYETPQKRINGPVDATNLINDQCTIL